MTTIDRMLDDIMSLNFDSREMLLEMLQARQIEARRDEIARNGKQTLKEYRSGKIQPQNGGEMIEHLI